MIIPPNFFQQNPQADKGVVQPSSLMNSAGFNHQTLEKSMPQFSDIEEAIRNCTRIGPDKACVVSVRDQGAEANESLFFKQCEGVNTKTTGRVLDGQTYDACLVRSESDILAAGIEDTLARDVIPEVELSQARDRVWERVERLNDQFLDYRLNVPLPSSIGHLQRLHGASGVLEEFLGKRAAKTVVVSFSLPTTAIPPAAGSTTRSTPHLPESPIAYETEITWLQLRPIASSGGLSMERQ